MFHKMDIASTIISMHHLTQVSYNTFSLMPNVWVYVVIESLIIISHMTLHIGRV